MAKVLQDPKPSRAYVEDITRQVLMAFASQNNIKDASIMIDEICEVASRWPKLAQECDVPSTMINAITHNMLLNI